MENTPQFRLGMPEDTPLILHFIQELAAYEKMEAEVVATEELLREWIFEKQKAEVLFVLEEAPRSALLFSFTISLRFSAGPVSTWKTCSSIRSTGARVMGKP